VPGRVVVVGSVNVDLVVTAPRLPAPGETVLGGSFARHDGGKGGNQAVAAARLGAATSLIAAVGDDDFGREARIALTSAGVDDTGVATVRGQATGVALIVVAPDGQNAIAVAPSANVALTPTDVEAALRRVAPGPDDVVLVGHEIPTESAAAALRVGRVAGAMTVLNPAPAHGIARDMLTLAGVVTPNESELAELAGSERGKGTDRPAAMSPEEAIEAARTLLGNGEPQGGQAAVLVSRGPAGAILVTADAAVIIPAPDVDALDATGAGDTLNGALAAGLAAALELEAASRRAVLAASLSTRSPGAREGMPTLADVEAFDKRQAVTRGQCAPSAVTQAENA
jgi:ribokinase